MSRLGPAPGFRSRPGYNMEIRHEHGRIRIVFGGKVVAETAHGVTVHESGYHPTHYLPREDVDMGYLVRSRHRTTCPFKGVAYYWSLRVGDQFAENAAWSYEDVYEEAAELENRIAFYSGRLDRLELTTPPQGHDVIVE